MALAERLAVAPVPAAISWVKRTDERHLFIPSHVSALPFSVSTELVFEDTLPPGSGRRDASVARAPGLSMGAFVESHGGLAELPG